VSVYQPTLIVPEKWSGFVYAPNIAKKAVGEYHLRLADISKLLQIQIKT
jgi:hypothetical protein